jgi:two-component system, sensor histidine kinase and response regulator
LLAAIDRTRQPVFAAEAAAFTAASGQEQAFDLAAALERVEGDRGLLEEIAMLFAEESAKTLGEIHAAFEAGDAALLERPAHTMKGASANRGAVRVSRAAHALEQPARAQDLSNARAEIDQLEREIEVLRPAIESLLKKETHGARL